ncbi:hypothetical protein [Prauserella muralis]|uniref:Uncharacterized protein n=1 Tax=Prauserella muralis TaxID=588067 RepID=A0A2V4BBC0_9PSEU|nr:hypothetical protein [Prauserella muralis]PXY32361.1 hypothetical protein BAY60_08825 [Prauserella muralis]TWE23955.1 hypothetical protein FHX69_5259 [Prauserella muralis]
MRTLSRAVLLAAVAATTAVLPATAATAAPAGPSGTSGDPEIIKTCGKGYSGYIRRFGKDALCLQPGTRTWSGFKAFECKGNITVYFKEGQRVECGGGVNFPYYGGVVKTVAR